MAFVNTIDEEEENTQGMNNSEEQSQSSPTSASGGAGSGGGTTSSAMSSPKAPQAAKPAASGSGPGFQNYYKANQGIAQARLNNAASSNVANQGKQAINAQNQATTAFGKRVDAGTLADRENAVKDVTDTTNAARGLTAGAAPAQPVTPPAAASDPVTGKPIAPQTANATAANPLTQAQTDRFGQVINASYKGPESLRQAGLYQPAADKTIAAQHTLNNTKTAAGREDLLKNMYQSSGNYGTGLNKLDSALLNANKQGVQALQDTAKAQGNLGQKLDQAQLGSANLAQNRTAEINKIKEDARNVFSAGKTAEEKATEDRMDAMLVTPVKDANGNDIMKPDGSPLTQWDQLPESFRDIIRNKKQNNQVLLDKQLAEYTSANKFQGDQQISGIDNQLKNLQAEIRKNIDYERATSPSNIGAWGTSPEAAAINEQIAALTAQKGTLTQQKSQYEKGLADITNNFNMDAVNFNPLEAEILGIQSGEGLFNLGENAIKTGVADRNKLVSRDEQLRQAVLSQLAGLDQSNRLDTNLKYADASKAGTQSILDSLDTEGTRTALDSAEQNFEDTAEGTDLVGKGKKKVSRGNMFGTTTRTYNAQTEANAADLLKGAGYDFDSVDEQGNPAYSKALLSEVAKTDVENLSKNIEKENAQAQLGSSAKGAAAGFAATGNPWGALVGAVLGNITQSGSYDPGQHGTNLVSGFTGENSMATKGHQMFKDSFGQPIGQAGEVIGGSAGQFLSNLGSSISGVDMGAMKQFGEAKAKQAALEDLKRQYSGFLTNQGFDNRVNVSNDEQSDARVASLLALMQGFDKTNT